MCDAIFNFSRCGRSEDKATVSKSSGKSAGDKDSAKLVNRNSVEAISEKRENRER